MFDNKVRLAGVNCQMIIASLDPQSGRANLDGCRGLTLELIHNPYCEKERISEDKLRQGREGRRAPDALTSCPVEQFIGAGSDKFRLAFKSTVALYGEAHCDLAFLPELAGSQRVSFGPADTFINFRNI